MRSSLVIQQLEILTFRGPHWEAKLENQLKGKEIGQYRSGADYQGPIALEEKGRGMVPPSFVDWANASKRGVCASKV